MALMTWEKVRGMMPSCPASVLLPSIVCVLPVPVCPYAKIVPLYPDKTDSIMGSAANLNTFSWRHPGWKVISKLKVLYCYRLSFWLWTMISPLSGITFTIYRKSFSFSLPDIGRHRTATFTHYFYDMFDNQFKYSIKRFSVASYK